MVCCSWEGEKLKPLVIAKSINPVTLRDANRQRMPVRYEANKKAWMTGTLFQELLLWFDAEMAKKLNIKDSGRKALLFMDNASVLKNPT